MDAKLFKPQEFNESKCKQMVTKNFFAKEKKKIFSLRRQKEIGQRMLPIKYIISWSASIWSLDFGEQKHEEEKDQK